MVTLKDVAIKAGVSIATASMVINNQAQKHKISLKTQDAVIKAVKELNYIQKTSSKKLRIRDNTITLGIYVEVDYSANFLTRIINGIRVEMQKSGIELNTIVSPFVNDRLQDKLALQDNRTMHAAIVAATYPKDINYLENIKASMPIVLYNRPSENCYTVEADNFCAGQKAADHLLECKVKTVGIAQANYRYAAILERNEGFVRTCIQHGIQVLPQFVLRTTNSMSGGFRLGKQIAQMKSLPDAFFCDSDAIAKGMISAFFEEGIKIPEDIGIVAIGMGDPDTCLYNVPSITTIDIPHEEMAAESVRLILEVIKYNSTKNIHRYCDSLLFVRNSSPKGNKPSWS